MLGRWFDDVAKPAWKRSRRGDPDGGDAEVMKALKQADRRTQMQVAL